jgi:hypothetical protein
MRFRSKRQQKCRDMCRESQRTDWSRGRELSVCRQTWHESSQGRRARNWPSDYKLGFGLTSGFTCPVDGSNMFLRNVGTQQKNTRRKNPKTTIDSLFWALNEFLHPRIFEVTKENSGKVPLRIRIKNGEIISEFDTPGLDGCRKYILRSINSRNQLHVMWERVSIGNSRWSVYNKHTMAFSRAYFTPSQIKAICPIYSIGLELKTPTF